MGMCIVEVEYLKIVEFEGSGISCLESSCFALSWVDIVIFVAAFQEEASSLTSRPSCFDYTNGLYILASFLPNYREFVSNLFFLGALTS